MLGLKTRKSQADDRATARAVAQELVRRFGAGAFAVAALSASRSWTVRLQREADFWLDVCAVIRGEAVARGRPRGAAIH